MDGIGHSFGVDGVVGEGDEDDDDDDEEEEDDDDDDVDDDDLARIDSDSGLFGGICLGEVDQWEFMVGETASSPNFSCNLCAIEADLDDNTVSWNCGNAWGRCL